MKENEYVLAYLGPRGTFTEEACLKYVRELEALGRATPGLISMNSIKELADAVEEGSVAEAVIPLENSTEGSVALALDLLLHRPGLLMKREIVIPVRHHLLVNPGTTIEQIKRVYSHPHAFAQCSEFLNSHLAGRAQVSTNSTAEAARLISARTGGLETEEDRREAAAIATRLAADLYELEVLRADIQDSAENATRFTVIARSDNPPTGSDKTSIAFSTITDRAGVLYEILRVFAEREINLTRIESRPAKRQLGEYVFFIDLEGHRQDPVVAEALGIIQRNTGFFKILGSYPRAVIS